MPVTTKAVIPSFCARLKIAAINILGIKASPYIRNVALPATS